MGAGSIPALTWVCRVREAPNYRGGTTGDYLENKPPLDRGSKPEQLLIQGQ